MGTITYQFGQGTMTVRCSRPFSHHVGGFVGLHKNSGADDGNWHCSQQRCSTW